MIQPNIYQIQTIESGSLSVMAKPVSGEWMEDEFAGIARWGISHIVSLLEYEEAVEVGLEEEQEMAEKHEMQFTSFPLPDRGLPSSVSEFSRFTKSLYAGIKAGDVTVVHCRAGIGRAGIVAAGVLLHHGLGTEQAFELISKQRRIEVPDTPEQYHWILKHEIQIREVEKTS
ncbi:MAG: protein-tyrosine phosphatase family protein [Planctomycetota bacterium]|jgi:protein-tyrosine phosphatase|uniref:protein-tyrosine phosphatase family protein n=1 Tax=uncultured Gimesia sp. TaxID=1678688 RepID=UPI002639F9AA|nr:protein-tyrosine phosphatase family protein [uncultured Gimesia sp.]